MAAIAQSASRTTTWQALGTTALLRLAAPGPLAEARSLAEAELDAIDRSCSRFREDSDLSRLNAAGGRAVAVDPLLMEALELALGAAQLTDGDVDPSIGVALELAGYDRDFDLLSRASQAEHRPQVQLRARRAPGWQRIQLDRESRVVRLPPGVKLDLGATAKAWAADRAAAAAFHAVGIGVLVALGGDVATAGPPPPAGWRIRVTDDHRSGTSAPGQTIAIDDGGIATSSTTVRRWLRGTTELHHIIDPRSGAPARGIWRTASVAAASAAEANIASTAAILRSRHAEAWLTGLGLPARLVALDGTVITLAGWPADHEQVAA
jgi:thiamine biosynthesis lipoprotein ApbE